MKSCTKIIIRFVIPYCETISGVSMLLCSSGKFVFVCVSIDTDLTLTLPRYRTQRSLTPWLTLALFLCCACAGHSSPRINSSVSPRQNGATAAATGVSSVPLTSVASTSKWNLWESDSSAGPAANSCRSPRQISCRTPGRRLNPRARFVGLRDRSLSAPIIWDDE